MAHYRIMGKNTVTDSSYSRPSTIHRQFSHAGYIPNVQKIVILGVDLIQNTKGTYSFNCLAMPKSPSFATFPLLLRKMF